MLNGMDFAQSCRLPQSPHSSASVHHSLRQASKRPTLRHLVGRRTDNIMKNKSSNHQRTTPTISSHSKQQHRPNKDGTPALPHRCCLCYHAFLRGYFIFAGPKYVVFSSLDKGRCHQKRRTRIPTQTKVNSDLSRRSIRNVPLKHRKGYD